MTTEEIIEMAKQAGASAYGRLWLMYSQDLEAFAKLIAERERKRITQLLKGIDETECGSDDGWWETSTGANFGSEILKQINGEAPEYREYQESIRARGEK